MGNCPPETELLLKRLTRDGELRKAGRYALIGAIRGNSRGLVTKHFAGRVNLAIDGEPVAASGQIRESRAPHWWRPFIGPRWRRAWPRSRCLPCNSARSRRR
jgi:negative regulator of sigma E activity